MREEISGLDMHLKNDGNFLPKLLRKMVVTERVHGTKV